MTAYELLCSANTRIMQDQPVPKPERKEIAGLLLGFTSSPDDVESFHKRMGATGANRYLYPLYYVPPYGNGSKCRLITGELPKTHILSANHYELEILRLLALWYGDAPAVKTMIAKTMKRLEATCFGRFCGTGECVGAGVTALRFYNVVLPPEDSRIERLLLPLGELFMGCSGHAAYYQNLPVRYFCLALAGISSEKALRIADAKREYLLSRLPGCIDLKKPTAV